MEEIEIIITDNKEEYKQEIIKYIKKGYKIKAANMCINNANLEKAFDPKQEKDKNLNIFQKIYGRGREINFFAIMQKEE